MNGNQVARQQEKRPSCAGGNACFPTARTSTQTCRMLLIALSCFPEMTSNYIPNQVLTRGYMKNILPNDQFR